MGTGELSLGTGVGGWGVTCDGLASHSGGVAIFLVASCYRNRDKLRQSWATRLVRPNHLSFASLCRYCPAPVTAVTI